MQLRGEAVVEVELPARRLAQHAQRGHVHICGRRQEQVHAHLHGARHAFRVHGSINRTPTLAYSEYIGQDKGGRMKFQGCMSSLSKKPLGTRAISGLDNHSAYLRAYGCKT